MVMRPDPRMGALTTVRRRNFGPWWLWLIVVALAMCAGYAGYLARFTNERLTDTSAALALLGADNAGLKKSLSDTKAQLDAAEARGQKAEAEAASISELLGKQQKRADDLREQVSAARHEAEASKSEAKQLGATVGALQKSVSELEAKSKSADDAFAQVGSLQKRLADLKAELAAGNAEIAKLKEQAAAEQKVLQQEVDRLKGELEAAQAKASAAPTSTAPPPSP